MERCKSKITMLIKLIRTGGLLPIKKEAELEVDWSQAELDKIVNTIKNETSGPGSMRDATNYLLRYDGETVGINWDKIPVKYLRTFEELRDRLAIVKR
jgi:hypothetical protein